MATHSLVASEDRRTSSRPLDELSFDISRAFYAYSGLLQRVLGSHGLDQHLRVGDGPVMFALFERDDLIIKDLVERTRLAPSTLTRIIRRMESARVIESRRCEDDGRATRVRLTPLGRSLESDCRHTLNELHDILEAGMTEPELRTLKRGFTTMIENMARCTWTGWK